MKPSGTKSFLVQCRRGEILTLRWDHVDLARECLRLPDSKSGAKVVQIGAPAREILANLPRDPSGYVIAAPGRWRLPKKRKLAPPDTAAGLVLESGGSPSPAIEDRRSTGKPLFDLETPWRNIRKAAELHDVRLHDLRHGFASVGAIGGQSLVVLGALLGHRNPSTTARYAHLSSDPLKRAADTISGHIASAMAGPGGGTVVPFIKGKTVG